MSPVVKGISFGLGAGAFWGLSFLIPKSYTDLSSGMLALARCGGFALVSLIVLARSRSLSAIANRHWKMALWLSITGYSFYFYLLIYSIRWAGIAVSSLIIGLLPITISLVSRERVRHPRLFQASIAMITVGILLLNIDGLSALRDTGADHTVFLLGVLLSVISLATWTAFSVQNSRYLKANPDIQPSRWAALLGFYSLVTILPLALLDLLWTPLPPLDSQLILHAVVATIVLGFGCSYVAGVLWNIASKLLPTSLTGQLIVSETVFALLYGYIHDCVFPKPLEILCIGLLIGGVVLGVRAFFEPK